MNFHQAPERVAVTIVTDNVRDNWAEPHVALLRSLYGSNLSHSEIATALNKQFGTHYTRNSSIGKIHRLKLPRRVPVLSDTERARRIQAREQKKQAQRRSAPREWGQHTRGPTLKHTTSPPVAPKPEPIPPAPSRDLTLFALESEDCRWITSGEGVAALFCGQGKAENSSYCQHHHDLSRSHTPMFTARKLARTAAWIWSR